MLLQQQPLVEFRRLIPPGLAGSQASLALSHELRDEHAQAVLELAGILGRELAPQHPVAPELQQADAGPAGLTPKRQPHLTQPGAGPPRRLPHHRAQTIHHRPPAASSRVCRRFHGWHFCGWHGPSSKPPTGLGVASYQGDLSSGGAGGPQYPDMRQSARCGDPKQPERPGFGQLRARLALTPRQAVNRGNNRRGVQAKNRLVAAFCSAAKQRHERIIHARRPRRVGVRHFISRQRWCGFRSGWHQSGLRRLESSARVPRPAVWPRVG